MEDNKEKQNIKDEVLGKIKSGEIQMKSKAYFLLRLCLLCILIFSIFIVLTFLLSYILFSLRAGGQMALLSFGPRGFYNFLIALPWFLLGINVILFILLDWLLKSFKFGYKSPIIYLFIGTFGIITVFGAVVNFTPFHSKILIRTEGGKPPPLPGLYEDIRRSHGEIGNFRGFVKDISTSSFVIEYDPKDSGRSEVNRVMLAPNSNVTRFIMVGDYVFVAGSIEGEVIRAYGVKKLVRKF